LLVLTALAAIQQYDEKYGYEKVRTMDLDDPSGSKGGDSSSTPQQGFFLQHPRVAGLPLGATTICASISAMVTLPRDIKPILKAPTDEVYLPFVPIL
jgi:hypothetical protein